MANIPHSRVDEPTSLIRPRLRNRSIQVTGDKLGDLHTIEV